MTEYIQLYQWEWIVFGLISSIYIWQRQRTVVLLSGMGVFCTSLAAVLHSVCMYLFPNLPYMFISFPMMCIATLWWIWFWLTIRPLFLQAFSFICMVVPTVCILFYGITSTDYLYAEHTEQTTLTFSQLNEASVGDVIRIPDGRCFPNKRGYHHEVIVKNNTNSVRSEVFLFAQRNWTQNQPVSAWISNKNLHPDRATRLKQCKSAMLLVVETIHDSTQQAIHNAIQTNSLKRGEKTTLLRRVKEKSELLETLQTMRMGLVFSIIVSLIGFVVKLRMPEPDEDPSVS